MFSVLIPFSLLIPTSAILYQGVKMVFPRSSKFLNFAIAFSISFVAVSIVANPILALLGLQSLPTAFSVPSIIGLIILIPVLLVVLIFTGLFIYCGVVYLQYRILRYRVLRSLDRYPGMDSINREIIIPSVRRNRSIRSRRRRPSGLILELDLTEDRT